MMGLHVNQLSRALGRSCRHAYCGHASTLLRISLLVTWFMTAAASEFIVQDIRVEGLQRISAGTVFNYLPVTVGARFDETQSAEVIRALFKTGFFTDVRLERDGNVLIVRVVERPAIAEVNVAGNRDISTDDLKKALTDIGLVEGRVFDRALLERVEQELLQLYFSRGKYAVKVDTTVQPLDRNRVAIDLVISEGVTARIRQINIIGNQAFRERELLRRMQLSTTGAFSFWTQNDRYSKQKLTADLETLRSFYLDRGYLKFNIASSQVSITPDKKDIYITINITEGDQYIISAVHLAGELLLPEAELQKLITIKPGSVFSRNAVATTEQALRDRLGDEGYALANVTPIPELSESDKTVKITLMLDPGRRMYVRRIHFKGNIKTHDEVLRRELRQQEGAWFATRDVRRSKERLERLPFIESAEVETPAVVGSPDQVDIHYSVTERPSGNFLFGVGYGQESGFLINASLNQTNFLGTGRRLNLTFNNSSSTTIYSVSYHNPYFTLNGISQGFNVYYRKRDAEELNTADYVVDDYGGQINFGIPLNEFDTVRFGFGYDNTRIKTTDDTPDEIFRFLDDNGDRYDSFKLEASWSSDTRNRAIFAERGSLNRIGAEITIPGSDLTYYKFNYRHNSYFDLSESLILSVSGEIGYGDGYGNDDQLPFFENYFAGGLRTVRGYKANTLGPRFSNGEPSGGSFKTVGSLEVIFPIPFLAQQARNMRLTAFVDGGNVFSSTRDLSFDGLRYSVGSAIVWLSPLGPLAVSLGFPLNADRNDKKETFQFSLGVPLF